MKKVLCPTDFSEAANNGIAYAGKLAQQLGASLTLFNVQSLANLTLQEAALGESLNAAAAEASLEQQCDEIQRVFKVSCDAAVATSIGSVINLISSKSDGYDLIAMGSGETGGLLRFLFGSNTYQVIKASSVPLLLIPAGCMYSEVRNVLYAFDYWHHGRLPLNQLTPLAKALGANLHVVQVMEESYRRKTEVEMLKMQEVFFGQFNDDFPISFKTIYATDPAEGLDSFALRSNTDMLALCTEHYGFFRKLFHKSFIKEMSSRVTYPLFVFHA
jgi:nucleotide-binding universal stress UspA family protein